MKILKLVACLLLCLAAGMVGSVFTMPSIPTWYAGLVKPPLNPPNWIFGPVWTTLFILMGIALFLVWESQADKKAKNAAMAIFGGQLALNVLWSILFFGLHSPFYAWLDIILLWISILITIISFWKISKLASILLWPYLLWVSFASYLNLMIWLLNR